MDEKDYENLISKIKDQWYIKLASSDTFSKPLLDMIRELDANNMLTKKEELGQIFKEAYFDEAD